MSLLAVPFPRRNLNQLRSEIVRCQEALPKMKAESVRPFKRHNTLALLFRSSAAKNDGTTVKREGVYSRNQESASNAPGLFGCDEQNEVPAHRAVQRFRIRRQQFEKLPPQGAQGAQIGNVRMLGIFHR